VDSDVRRSKIGRRDTVIGKGLMSCFAVEIARFQVLHKSAEELDPLLGYAYCAVAAIDVMAHMRDLRILRRMRSAFVEVEGVYGCLDSIDRWLPWF
jgi:hypothetical protein